MDKLMEIDEWMADVFIGQHDRLWGNNQIE